MTEKEQKTPRFTLAAIRGALKRRGASRSHQDRWWGVIFVNVCVEKALVMSTLDHAVS